tara:strand:+ start:841 stop:1311 length:471 start_codon:yes stop_codon:yes gene_type:complete
MSDLGSNTRDATQTKQEQSNPKAQLRTTMATFALFNVLAVHDISSDGELEQENFYKTFEPTKVSKSCWADCDEHNDPTFQKVVKKTKKKGDGSQKNKCIGKLIFVHPSGKWGKIERQDTGENVHTQLTNNLSNGSRVRFVLGENHKGPCALSVELI